MLNFDFKRTNRKCSVCDRAFDSGEEFVSALVEVDGELIRKDFAVESWAEPPENCIGWWKSRMPDLDKGRVYWAPNDVLLAYFQHVLAQPESQDAAYVMAVLLVRKRTLQMVETDESTQPPTMVVHHRRTNTDFRVAAMDIPGHRIAQIQNELCEHLFTNQAPSADAIEEDSD
jgi:hypothetical protein